MMHLSVKFSNPAFVALAMLMAACGGNRGASASAPVAVESEVSADVTFDADSAYAYVARQVEFGPRVPGSGASAACADWLVGKLREFGARDISQQRARIKAYNGDILDIQNISASINPDAAKRVLLLAHWDSRPWADHDPDPAMRDKPIDGANDGASGVGVILEIVRQLQAKAPQIGVDVLFVDAEDYGRREGDGEDREGEDSWALGTQHWVANPTLPLESIDHAVLLDMVGGKNAVFPREYFSQQGAGDVVDQLWRAGARAGHSSRFINDLGGAIIDDHVYLLRAGVPAIDIIETVNPATGSFNPTWHTHADNIGNIDRQSLRAVGETLLDHIYSLR